MIQAACELDYTHEKTILTAYRLYAKKLISYPAVLQNTVPGGVMESDAPQYGDAALQQQMGPLGGRRQASKYHNFRNGESVYNGFGIVTTGLHPTDLSRDEEKLYNLIVKRVIDAFAPDTCGKGSKSKSGKKK